MLNLLNSMDGKYVLTGGEDDLVQVWSMEDRKVVAWGEGHNSWVSYFVILAGTSFFVIVLNFCQMLQPGQWSGF